MKKLLILSAFIFITISSMQAQQMFQKFSGTDIGNPKLKGSFQFDKKNQQFILEGAGYNIWFERDEFYFVSQEVEGDFILSANLKFLGEGVDAHRKIGLMIRNSKAEDAVYMDGAVHGDGLTSLQYREKAGGETMEMVSEIKAPEFVQVERKGNEFIFRLSKDQEPLIEVGRVALEMSAPVFAGMFISSHNEEVVEKAQFWNMRLEKPAVEGVDGYQNLSPSRLEILDIETGNRKVIYETETHIEAPNWSRNGKSLVYNSGGLLYNFNLKKRKPKVIDTGFATSNNNDHGISFDGKMLAISSGTPVGGRNVSIIYTVPVKGGTPERITEKGPSYWHGWSPDDKWHVYCAERNGNYDVYKIPAGGGEEIRLTTAEGLDDGPEYSPDGKWLIMISYLPEVPASSHPHNQRVMLRMMPANGGEIKTVAFLYGGQGTINVPSWSPDSKKVAFMSYTY